MQPTLIFPWIHCYGLLMAVGFYAGWWLAARRAKAEGVDPDVVGNLVLVSIVAGVLGSRVVWFALYHDPREPWWTFFEVWKGGLVFYGGLAAAVAADYVYLRWKGAAVWQVADILAPAIPLGHAFGRIGCFLNGCCYGGLCTAPFPLGVRFPAFLNEVRAPIGSPAFLDHLKRQWVVDTAGAALPVHPTQLYAAGSLFLIAMLLILASRYKRRHGELLGLLCVLHGTSRFAVELVRRDAESFALGLTAGQVGAVAVLALGAALFVWARRRGKPVPWPEPA